MRRKEREMRNRETIIAMLEQSSVGRIATINQKGIPIIKPVNFLYWDGKIYLHSSMKGEKLNKMAEKYQPEGNDGEISVEILKKTAVIEILIEEITGKENLG